MERKAFLDASIQVAGLVQLEKEGFLNQFRYSYGQHIAEYWYIFYGGSALQFQYGDQTIIKDFSKYRIELNYGRFIEPTVFVTSVIIPKNCPHRFPNGSLCLYKNTNFKWSNHRSLAKDILPSLYAWLYFYEQWQITGQWHGLEAKH